MFHGENLGYIAGWLCFNLGYVGTIMFRVQGLTGRSHQELRFEAAENLDKFMTLEKLEEEFSGKRVKFAVEKGEI